MKPTAYEGKENYIFISYAHKDKDVVFEVLQELEADGYRFWYDDGIAPGSEWPEDIAMHLSNAAAVIAFITPNAVASPNCRREINFSLSKNKPFLSILMERTEMSPGLEMQLSAQQSVIRYNYDTWEAFIKKIKKCPALEPCRKEPEARLQDVPAPAVSAPAAPSSAAAQAEPAPTPAVSASVAEAPAAVERKGRKEKKVREKPVKAAPSDGSVPKKKSRVPKIIGGVLLAAVLLLVLLVTQTNKKVKMSWGDEVSVNVQTWIVKEQTVTQDDLIQVAKSKELYTMEFVDCDLSGCDFGAVDYKSGNVTNLEFNNCKGIRDYSFLGGMNLRQLTISGDPSFKDLSVVNAASLERLNVSGTGVTDLSPLADADKLQSLNISGTEVSDLSALKPSELTVLNASETKLDLADVAGFPALTELNLSGCDLKDGSAHMSALRLNKLHLANCGLTDLSAFSDCTVLKELNVSGNAGLTDMSWLNAQNHETLQVLDVSGTGLSAEDVAFIGDCKGLTKVNLRGVALDDLSFCADHASLEWIAADGCGLSDISGLGSCPALKRAFLSFNKISDISALSGVNPSADVVLDLSFNEIGDASPLPAGQYRAVMLCGNDPKAAGTLSEDVGGYQVFCDWYEGIEAGPLVTGKGTFAEIYIVGCPASQQVNVENGIGKTRLHLITYDEIYDDLIHDNLEYKLSEDYTYPAALYKKNS